MIRLASIWKHYDEGGFALQGVDLHVNRGEVVFITGTFPK